MLQPSTLRFLKDLHRNNNKPWFDANRKSYENAKEDVAEMVEGLIKAITVFEPGMSILKAKDCTFRINRDVRFSKDKHPYKNNMGAYFSSGGKKAEMAGYYLHVEPGKSFAGGGFYNPMPPSLARIRQEIDYNHDEWMKIINEKKFKGHFPNGLADIGSLVRPPKGYDENNPAISFLKMKGFIVTTPISDTELQDKQLIKKVTRIFESMQPMVTFLNRAIE